MEPISGYEGLYEIHLTGTLDGQPGVWSIPGKCKDGRYLKTSISNKGYKAVNLCKNGKYSGKTIHRLTAEHFIINPFEFTDVDHVDENKLDCRVQNLRWLPHAINKLNVSKYKGYRYRKDVKKYEARMRVFGEQTVIGYFDNEEDARAAYISRRDEIISEYTVVDQCTTIFPVETRFAVKRTFLDVTFDN